MSPEEQPYLNNNMKTLILLEKVPLYIVIKQQITWNKVI